MREGKGDKNKKKTVKGDRKWDYQVKKWGKRRNEQLMQREKGEGDNQGERRKWGRGETGERGERGERGGEKGSDFSR